MSLIEEYRRGRDLGICHQRFETTFKISTAFSFIISNINLEKSA